VADGTATHDAVNYGQLRKVIAGVAGVAAMANIPQVDQGKTFSVGAGVSSFMGANALGDWCHLPPGTQCGGEGFRRGAE
jgi:autotransporter adhesin